MCDDNKLKFPRKHVFLYVFTTVSNTYMKFFSCFHLSHSLTRTCRMNNCSLIPYTIRLLSVQCQIRFFCCYFCFTMCESLLMQNVVSGHGKLKFLSKKYWKIVREVLFWKTVVSQRKQKQTLINFLSQQGKHQITLRKGCWEA